MARTRSLQDLVADVRWIADVEGATARHTDKKIVRALNQSQQAFRLMVSIAGHPYYISDEVKSVGAGSNTFTPTSTDIVAVLGLDVLVDSDLIELVEFQFSERNKYPLSQTGRPVMFRYMAEEITIQPTSDADYTFRIWYLPVGTEFTATYDGNDMITASSSSFDGIAGWEDWLVYDSALRISTRDAGVNDNFELIQAELGRIERRILAEAKKRVRVGPLHRVDTRGRRKSLEQIGRLRLP